MIETAQANTELPGELRLITQKNTKETRANVDFHSCPQSNPKKACAGTTNLHESATNRSARNRLYYEEQTRVIPPFPSQQRSSVRNKMTTAVRTFLLADTRKRRYA